MHTNKINCTSLFFCDTLDLELVRTAHTWGEQVPLLFGARPFPSMTVYVHNRNVVSNFARCSNASDVRRTHQSRGERYHTLYKSKICVVCHFVALKQARNALLTFDAQNSIGVQRKLLHVGHSHGTKYDKEVSTCSEG